MSPNSINYRLILLSAVMLVLLALTMEACGNDDTPSAIPLNTKPSTTSTTTAVKDNQPVTLRWSYWGSDVEVEINKKIAAQFEKLHPEIKIEHLFVPFEQYFDKFKAD